MVDRNLTTLNDSIGVPSDATLPVAAGQHGNGEWDGAPAPAAARPAMSDIFVYVHALRRHWLLSLGLGLLCAAILGPVAYFAVDDKFTSTSFLRIGMQESFVVFKDQAAQVDSDRFGIYKSTRQTLLTNVFVLRAALRKQEVARLPFTREQPDPAKWLEKRVSVSFPGKAEVMAVGVTSNNKKEAQVLCKAVVDSYLTEVVDAETSRKRTRLSDLEKLFGEREQDLRKKRESLKTLAQTTGISDSENLTQQQKLALDDLNSIRVQADRTQADIAFINTNLAGRLAARRRLDASDVSIADLNAWVREDPKIKELSAALADRQRLQQNNSAAAGIVKPGVARGGFLGGVYEDDSSRLQRQYDARVNELKGMIWQKAVQELDHEIVQLQAQKKAKEQQNATERRTIAKKRIEAAKFGVTSVEIEMLRSDLAHLDAVQSQITNEMEKLKVELNSDARVRLMQPAEEPIGPSNGLVRVAIAVAAMLAGLCCPAALIMIWDLRTRRINSASDLSQGLQLSVIGSVPLIPAKVIRRLGSPSPRHRAWHLRLTESVDGIAARLLHKADVEQCRVIMVSSATSGEGKTTLATQLAMSLARTGRQVVLVDFDLRRPSFDQVFGVPLTPGVSESLRKECNIAEVVHPNVSDNLAVVAAGRWNRQALAALSNGGVAALFKELRETFEFVVVDTSPILPIADARFVSKFVDTVVLSVFRDVSEAPQIQAACDILSAFGVRSVEAVITGQNSDLYGKHTGYESTVSA
jgi:polysaccharide biosynthesis transport protein